MNNHTRIDKQTVPQIKYKSYYQQILSDNLAPVASHELGENI